MLQLVAFVFLCFVWGTTWVAIKVTLEGFPPFLGASARFIVAILVLFLYTRWQSISLKVERRDFPAIIISAFLMYTLDYGLVYWGEQHLSAGVTAIFFATFPLFTGIWSNFLFHHERFRWHKFAGLILGFLGIVVVFYDQLIATHFSQLVILATLAIIAGAAGGAMSVIIIQKYLNHLHPITLSFHQMLQGIIFLGLFGLLLESPGAVQMNNRVGFALLYLGLVGSALAFTIYYWLLQHLSAITLSLIIYITPLVALVVDYWVYGEVVAMRTILGMFVIFAGIALTEAERYRNVLHHRKLKTSVRNS